MIIHSSFSTSLSQTVDISSAQCRSCQPVKISLFMFCLYIISTQWFSCLMSRGLRIDQVHLMMKCLKASAGTPTLLVLWPAVLRDWLNGYETQSFNTLNPRLALALAMDLGCKGFLHEVRFVSIPARVSKTVSVSLYSLDPSFFLHDPSRSSRMSNWGMAGARYSTSLDAAIHLTFGSCQMGALLQPS